jgi:hypothetical protein
MSRQKVIVRLKGGLGNQMFQYACGRALCERTGGTLLLDLHELLDRTPRDNFVYRDYDLKHMRVRQQFVSQFEIAQAASSTVNRIVARVLRRSLTANRVSMEILPGPFRPEICEVKDSVLLDGYWQDERYFKDVGHVLKDEFRLWHAPRSRAKLLLDELSRVNAVCLHVRRTDFLNYSDAVCSADYFRLAYDYMCRKIQNPVFYVFSDDLQWCEEQLTFVQPSKMVYADLVEGDLLWYQNLMQNCQHFIIPNSTYSWWAAWLAENPQKIVVAPERWFRSGDIDSAAESIVPQSWVRL